METSSRGGIAFLLYETRGRSRVYPVEADGTAATYDMVETALPTSAHFENTPNDGRAARLESGEIVRAVASLEAGGVTRGGAWGPAWAALSQ